MRQKHFILLSSFGCFWYSSVHCCKDAVFIGIYTVSTPVTSMEIRVPQLITVSSKSINFFFSWLINFLIFLLWKIVFLRTEYPRYYSFIFAVSQGNEPGNRTGYDRSPEYLITCLEQRGGPSIRTNEVDKPPSYDGGERELYEDMSVLKIIRRN